MEDGLHSPYPVLITLMPWVAGGKKNGWQGAKHVMLVGAQPSTVQEFVWTNLQEEYKSWKGVDYNPFGGDRNLVNAKNTPVVLVMAIAAFDRAHQWWIIIYFMKMALPRTAIYRVCQCIEKKKTAKRKAESGRRAVQMPEKRNQLLEIQ